MNLSDADDGMVSLNKPTTAFVSREKNVRQDKELMDSTPIMDIMDEAEDPRMMMMPPRMMMQQPSPAPTAMPQTKKADTKNPLNLTDDQLTALIVAVCTAISISKPIQEKLASTIPQFLNDSGSRSLVGLAATGLVAAIIFYVIQTYVMKR